MFSVDRFIEGCRRIVTMADAEVGIEQLVAEAIAEPVSVLRALREPERAGFEVLHRGPDLTVLHFAWAPWMSFKAHNHSMWSVVGIFSGREDNIFWRRTPAAIEAAGARSLGTGSVARFGRNIIHSV